jgi:hypothetical protein
MIGGLTKADFDNRARTLATTIRQWCSDVTEFQQMIAAANAAGELTSTDVGYTSGSQDLTNVIGMADQYAQAAQVFTGQQSVPTATNFDSYGAAVPSLYPDTRGNF